MMKGLRGCALMASSAFVVLAASSVEAQARPIDIPAQPMESAVTALGQQAGVQILAARRFTHGKMANAVSGNLTVPDALARMLDGSGLSGRQTGPQTYAVVAVPTAALHRTDGRSNGAVMLAQATMTTTGSDSPPALAEVKSDPPHDSDAAGVPDIIVTAARTAQNLQKVSAAVQVVDGAKLKDQGLTNVGQIFATTPSVQATAQPGGFSIDIRGQGGDMPSGSAQGSVALEFDGVYSILSQSSTIGFFDVDRIEVLPGPQSTRYGPNADGGVVNVITKDPVIGSFAGEGSLTLGNYGLVRGEFAQNIAISNTLALRVSGAAIRRSSYYSPIGANAIGQSARVKLLYKPSADLSIKLEYQFDHVGGTGPGVEPYVASKVTPYSGDSINDYSNPWAHADSSTNTGSSDNKANIKQQTFLGNVGWQFSDWAAIDVQSAYIKVTGHEVNCYPGGPPWGTGGDHSCYDYYQFAPYHQFSTEARLHNATGSRIIWNIGYYHFNYLRQTYNDSPGNAPAGPIGGSKYGTTTNALFGEITYPVTDRFRLIGGLRQSWDQRSLRPAGIETLFTSKSHHFDYRAGEEFDVSPTSMEYFTVSSGYRPGGLTGYNTVTSSPYTFSNEVNTAFELGLKNRFFGNRLQINGDVFYYRQRGYQDIDTYNGFVPSTGGSACTPNDPRPSCSVPTFNLNAHLYGAETQIRFSPTRNDVFGLNVTYLHARFDKSQGTCATVAAPGGDACWIGYNDQASNALLFFDVAGAVQPHSPTISGTFSYTHTFRLASGATLAVGGDVFHTSGYWVHPVQDANLFGYQPGYWQEGLNATFTPPSNRWSVSAYARNLSNYAVKESTLPVTALGDPRTYGVTFGFKW